MQRFQSGDAPAFQVLLQRHSQKVFNFLLRQVHDPTLAEDLVQEVFLRVVKNARGFRAESKFTTWMYTIARNQVIDHARKAKHRRTVALDQPLKAGDERGATLLDRVENKDPATDTSANDRRFVAALEKALAELPSDQREVFMLREMQGLKFREIADVLNIPENTVKSRMRYALEQLRGHLAAFREAGK